MPRSTIRGSPRSKPVVFCKPILIAPQTIHAHKDKPWTAGLLAGDMPIGI